MALTPGVHREFDAGAVGPGKILDHSRKLHNHDRFVFQWMDFEGQPFQYTLQAGRNCMVMFRSGNDDAIRLQDFWVSFWTGALFVWSSL